MNYLMTGVGFEGLNSALLKWPVYGLILLGLLWVGSELVNWGFKALKRRFHGRKPVIEVLGHSV